MPPSSFRDAGSTAYRPPESYGCGHQAASAVSPRPPLPAAGWPAGPWPPLGRGERRIRPGGRRASRARSLAARSGTIFWLPTTQITAPAPYTYRRQLAPTSRRDEDLAVLGNGVHAADSIIRARTHTPHLRPLRATAPARGASGRGTSARAPPPHLTATGSGPPRVHCLRILPSSVPVSSTLPFQPIALHLRVPPWLHFSGVPNAGGTFS
jgi:hypothetical protein